jgi:hypothetical protein
MARHALPTSFADREQVEAGTRPRFAEITGRFAVEQSNDRHLRLARAPRAAMLPPMSVINSRRLMGLTPRPRITD